MLKKQKRSFTTPNNDQSPAKKFKKDVSFKNTKSKDTKHSQGPKEAHSYFSNLESSQEKPNWTDIKKQSKELRVKRKQSKAFFDVMTEAKTIAEKLRIKQLKGGTAERNELVSQLHRLLTGKQLYSKLVLTHDMARVVQYLLKFGTENIRNSIAKELIPLSVDMLLSKYGRYCFKNMLKYGNGETRRLALEKLYGNAVKLTSHVVSAVVFEYAYTTWASPVQKYHFIQEFFGDMYKQSKDNSVKHLRDVYQNNDSLKTAALSAVKANLLRVFNKNLFDSGLVQSVLSQYITECTVADRTDLISQLAEHAVVLSNSRDGAKVVMQCIWHGTNKEKKTIIKSVKENLLDLCKHEFAHCVIITLLDAVDDTVLLNKTLVTQIMANAKDLVTDEWGRKVLLWLVTPGDAGHFHPTFVNELSEGQKGSTGRKDGTIRRSEILNHCSADLLTCIATDAQFWLSKASIALVTLSIIKSADDITDALQSICKTITDPEWRITENDKEMLGVEHSGLHMMLKKLAQNDKGRTKTTFGETLVTNLNNETVKAWIAVNRGCFLLVVVYDNNNIEVQQKMKQIFTPHLKLLKKQTSVGAKILLEKLL